jgi:ABC-2 type transport system ATP-binding protein
VHDVIVETDGLTKLYGAAVRAVDRLDLSIRAGEVYGFLGANGAGKTTTLRMLAGLVRPTDGRATVLGGRPGGRDVLGQIGALVERPAFYPYLSGGENLLVLARYAGVGGARVAEVLGEVGLSGRAGDKVKGYSTGMRQRLGLAAALLKRPRLLLLDEPTTGLDPQGTAEIRGVIRSLGDSGTTILFSSHVLGEVEQVCDRAGIIRAGRLVTEGTIEELRGATGVLVRADPEDKARTILVQLLGASAVSSAPPALRVDADPSSVPELMRELVGAEIDVHELRPVERSLEDAFLEVTREPA